MVDPARRWRRAMVTGASSGIGEAIAQQLALDGVDLVLIGRNVEALEAVGERARAGGVRAEVLAVDLASPEGVDRAVSCLRAAGPMVDLLVNNAGVGQWGPFVDLPVDGAIETIRVNCEALVRLTYAAVTRMVDAGHGSIVQISSMAARGPGPSQAVYAASKAFVSSFGQALAAELASTAVTCTTVLPGYTRTRYFERVGLAPDVPDDHWLTPGQVAVMSLDGARRGQLIVYARAAGRWETALTRRFPSLADGPIRRRVGQARRLAVRIKRRVSP